MLDKLQNHRYIPGLDGLRAVAVLSVLAYHFGFSWAKGGFLGVDIFFVLSGYLITSTILPGQGERITLQLRKFWLKRIRRLLPAAYVMIISTFVWVILFHRELLDTMRGDTIASLFYVSNWWFIFHKLSYFDSFRSPSPLKNLWSLAIEEQFYLIWPILLAIGLYICKKQSRLSLFIFSGALCSAIVMAVLYQPGADPSRIYYGTDTRSFELLIGCCLAFIWPMKRLSSKKLPNVPNHSLNLTSIIAFGIFILCVFFVDEYSAFLYRGGMLLICLNAAILVACVCHPTSVLGKILSFQPLRWIGSRSYGIYLWHYPILVFFTPIHEIGNPSYWRVGLQLAITLIIAELSYRFIEMPIRKHGFRSFFQQHLTINISIWKTPPFIKRVSTALIPLVILVFTAGITGIVKGEQPMTTESHPTEVKIINEEQPSEKQEGLAREGQTSQQDDRKDAEVNVDQNKETVQKEKHDTSGSVEQKAYTEILAIGDSVMIDIASSLHKRYPNITIDAKVGRQMAEAVKLIPSYAEFNHPDKAIIIELGTNGYFTANQIDTVLGAFSDAHIYLVNTRVPRSWESKVNDTLAQKAQEHDNITLVDWHSAAIDHPEYFAADGVHLVPKGIEALTNLLDQAIGSNNRLEI